MARRKLFSKYPTDGIVVKINSRKLQLIREKSNLDCPYWQVAIKVNGINTPDFSYLAYLPGYVFGWLCNLRFSEN